MPALLVEALLCFIPGPAAMTEMSLDGHPSNPYDVCYNICSLQHAYLLQAKRGTPCYMAPELFSEGATHSTASDLWSLGCVLYECATGRPPFMDSSFNQLAHDILNKEPTNIQGWCVARIEAGPSCCSPGCGTAG